MWRAVALEDEPSTAVMRRREVLTVGAEGLKSASSENFYQNILRDLSIGNFWIINTDN